MKDKKIEVIEELTPQTVITLENERQFMVIETLEMGKNIYAMLCSMENNDLFCFCVQEKTDEGLNIKIIQNEYLIKQLVPEFNEKVQARIKKMKDDGVIK